MDKGAGRIKKLGNGARSKRNYQGAAAGGKLKKEQEAKRDEKGALVKRSERRKMEGRTGKNVEGNREPRPP